jgi:5,10-methylenetetrahydrofolate reductase
MRAGLAMAELPNFYFCAGRLPPQMVAGMERSMLAGLQQRHLVTSLPHLTPNLYEMAALTQELDTQVSPDITKLYNNARTVLTSLQSYFFLFEFLSI